MSRRNTLVDDSIVINNILQWVEDGNPEISDDEDDLHELYGDEDESMHVQEAIGEESVAAHSQDTEIQEQLTQQPCTSTQCLEGEEIIPPRKNYPVRREPPVTSSSEDEEGIPIVPARGKRRLLTSNRLVHSIDSALNHENYEEIVQPCNTKGDDTLEILTGYLGPKSNPNTEKIYWTSEPNTTVGRQRACDVIGPNSTVRYAADIKNINDCFSKLINEEMVDLVVSCTNARLENIIAQHIDKIENNSRYGWIRLTDATEIKALFGLMYFRGLMGLHNHSHDILFSENAGHPMFAATMSRNRFTLLIANLSFDTQEEREEKWKFDRFTAIRKFFELFNLNCLKHVVPSEYLSLDETLYPMRNQIGIKQYNPNKPAKYGLLFKSLNDARYPYTYQSIVYAGKPEKGDGPFYITGNVNYIKTLVEKARSKLSLEGRNISMDRLYTSIAITNWLLEKKITVVGTMMKNRAGIPDELKLPGNRDNFSFSLHWESEKKDIAICTYIVNTKSKGKKSVILLSSMRPCFGKTCDDGKEKPQIYKLYDFTKGGTDIVDQKAGQYTCKSKARKWKMAAFFYILDTTRINAATMISLKTKKNPRKQNSFDNGFELAKSLVVPQIMRRPKIGLSKTTLLKMSLIVDENPRVVVNNVPSLPKAGEQRRYCRQCLNDISGDEYNSKKRKLPRNKSQCQKCGESYCPSHLLQICNNHNI